MPTYEYECPTCGIIEIFHSMSEHKKKCPNCKRKITKRISSGGGVIFKGAGFYATDYRS